MFASIKNKKQEKKVAKQEKDIYKKLRSRRYAGSQLENYSKNNVSQNNEQNNKRQIYNEKSISSNRNYKKLTEIKSEYSISLNQAHKQRIIEQRHSYNVTGKNKNKNRSNSIDNTFCKVQDESKQIINLEKQQKTLLNKENILICFITQCYKLELQYKQNCQKGKYEAAFIILATLLNYSIDIGNHFFFNKIIYLMCQFHQILQNYKLALKFYIQLAQATLIRKNYRYFVISMIGISKCCIFAHENMLKESIIFLKKGLQYAWYIDSTQLQMNLYDQIGNRYYKMGELQKANIYHKKYSDCITQDKNTSLRVLSKHQIELQHQKYLTLTYSQFSPLFLAHLTLPITSTQELPQLIPGMYTSRLKLSLKLLKQQGQAYQIDIQLKKYLKSWIFEFQSEQPSLSKFYQQKDQQDSKSNKKNLLLDFKINKHLQQKGLKFSPSKSKILNGEQGKQQPKRKKSLEQQIRGFIEQPQVQKSWYNNIIKKVRQDQKNKINQVSNRVRITKSNVPMRNKQQKLKLLYNQMMQFFNNSKIKKD